jgi:Arginine repressor, DNA binding domain
MHIMMHGLPRLVKGLNLLPFPAVHLTGALLHDLLCTFREGGALPPSGEGVDAHQALLEILTDRRNIGSQTELQELLREREIEAAQSSVSDWRRE